ncbi:protein-lysine N-methyltransferase Ecym_1127 [Eremothecium cymbalariae DBVPG|uniref:FAM86 N-terminal domain-containing protein n=1 Tax=Eremothecium cymbalariae (strain CBS 270.75 / DBVPG 7215 / KCTC 17166 / NRRL Y-17582) TaxID=931890 RepID=G8JMM5_ERECY|nr:hypothetical protein Ecym_1127 [Eremothecium cymbalariae DBVPG\
MAEQLLYNKLHQRYPIGRLPDLIKELKLKFISTDKFIQEFEFICKRNPYYAKNLLKWMIDEPVDKHVDLIVGEDGSNLSDWMYTRYIGLLPLKQQDPTHTDIVRYTFGEDSEIEIDVRETRNLVCASGSTGFRTWEAALYLCHYLCESRPRFGTMLELGAGTGIVSLTWHKLQSGQFMTYATDGDKNIIGKQLKETFISNGVDLDKGNVHLQRLLWNVDSIPKNDIILAADVTYDHTAIPDLCACIHKSFLNCGTQVALVAATIRNERTISMFEDTITSLGLQLSVVRSTESNTMKTQVFVKQCTFKSLLSPIRIYKVTE